MKNVVNLKNVQIYQSQGIVLKEVNLIVNQGEFVYLVGKTGLGKTSLLKTLYGELPLSEGEGTVVGYDLKKKNWKNIHLLRRHLGIVFQDFQLLNDRNVYENLKFVLDVTGWKDIIEINRKIEEVLTQVGLQDKSYKMPYDLSGGEQNRVDIARALLNNPELILADEPTGNLDFQSSIEIMELLFNIVKTQNTAVIMATHDLLMVQKYPAKKYETMDGKLIFLG